MIPIRKFCKFFLLLIRSLLFNIVFFIILAYISTFFAFVSKNNLRQKVIGWVRGIEKSLRFFVGLDYKCQGNLLNRPALYASRHESTWETVIFFIVFRANPFILKKELTNIPFFGRFLIAMGMISVDRSNVAESIKKMIRMSKKVFADKDNLIIFPEATRKPAGVFTEINTGGVFAVYRTNNVPVVPVVVNSGKFWHRRSFIKYPGTIIIRFLDPIEPGLSKDEFHQVYNEKMRLGLELLYKEH